MAAPDVACSDNENTALNSANRSEENLKSNGKKQKSSSMYGAASSFDSVEGLTPSGYEVNMCQLPMLCCWLTVGGIPNLAALIVGFENRDLKCNEYYNNYGWIHPRAYLKITGIIGIIISIFGTWYVYYLIKYHPEILEIIVNGKIFQFEHPMHPYPKNGGEKFNIYKCKMVLNKVVAMSLILVSFIWDIVGWFIVSKLNLNGCSDELITQTILAWTIINMLLLICALSSRFVKRSKSLIIDSEADIGDQEEGSVDHK